MTALGRGGLKPVGDISLMLLQLRLCKSTVKLTLGGTQEPDRRLHHLVRGRRTCGSTCTGQRQGVSGAFMLDYQKLFEIVYQGCMFIKVIVADFFEHFLHTSNLCHMFKMEKKKNNTI